MFESSVFIRNLICFLPALFYFYLGGGGTMNEMYWNVSEWIKEGEREGKERERGGVRMAK